MISKFKTSLFLFMNLHQRLCWQICAFAKYCITHLVHNFCNIIWGNGATEKNMISSILIMWSVYWNQVQNTQSLALAPIRVYCSALMGNQHQSASLIMLIKFSIIFPASSFKYVLWQGKLITNVLSDKNKITLFIMSFERCPKCHNDILNDARCGDFMNMRLR